MEISSYKNGVCPICRVAYDEKYECMCESKKTFLECMFNDLDSIYGDSEKKVKKDLLNCGINLQDSLNKFLKFLREMRSDAKI